METILLVDDEPEILRVQKFSLQRNGYHIVTAGDADTALLRLADPCTSIDMVITDHAMPEMTGLDLLKYLRANKIFIPVIIMTAFGEKKLVIEALQNQCDGFIEKPFTMDQLLHEIQRAKQSRPSETGVSEFKRLFSRVLHQINNPLMAISGHAEISLYSPETPRNLKNRFETIVKSVNIIKGLNQEILQMGAARSDHKIVVDLVDLVDESLDLFEGVMAREKIDVQKISSQKEVMVLGKKAALGHVLSNLIQNSVHAVAGREIRNIRVTVTPMEETSTVRIRVEDTGCGIDETDLAKIFDPYFTSKEKGTGLGLAIAREIIESHGGKITVSSRAGKGTCFRIDLPSVMKQQEKTNKGGDHVTGN